MKVGLVEMILHASHGVYYWHPQRAEYGLIKEYTSNHIRDLSLCLRSFPSII